MTEMPWYDAIVKVLEDSPTPMHYNAISQEIIDNGYRDNFGATPANSVAATLAESLRSGKRSRFVRVERGVYTLRDAKQRSSAPVDADDQAEQDSEEMGLINAFGMFWDRDKVDWQQKPVTILGVQLDGSRPVDFSEQAGIYILYDVNRPVYVGRVTEQCLGQRLFAHTRGRLKGRWDRFSWFGVRRARDDTKLMAIPKAGVSVKTLIATMEALLIEGLEPPQNRRQGDGFKAIEFIQFTEP